MSNSVCYVTAHNVDNGGNYFSNYSAQFDKWYNYEQPSPGVLGKLRRSILADSGRVTNAYEHGSNAMNIACNNEEVFAVRLSGTLPTVHPGFLWRTVEKHKTQDFRKRVLSGDIVVNPYQKHTASITFDDPIPIIIDKGTCPYFGYPGTWYGNTGRRYFPYNSHNFIPKDGKFHTVTQYVSRRHGELVGYDIPTNYVSEEQLKSRLKILVPVLDDPSFVQDTFADANGRSVDFLTSVFELPETILSIGDVWKSTRRIIQSFISKRNLNDKERERFLVRHASLVNNARIKRQQFAKKIADFMKGKDVDGLNPFDASHLKKMQQSLAYWNRRIKTLEKEKTNVLLKLATALSNLWLQFRYEIMPNIYLAQDLASTAESQWNVFQTERSKFIDSYEAPNLDGFSFEGTSQVTWKCMVKYGYSKTAQNLRDLRKAFSTNTFLTLWELGKLTFVLDWFFSVGSYLGSAFGKPSLAVTDGATLSSKWVIDGTYTHLASGTSFSYKYEGYIRRVVTSQEFEGIFFRINLNWKRYADAGALLFGELKRHFKLR